MGAWWSRATPEKPEVRVLVLGEQSCGKTTFIDKIDGSICGDATAIPTTGLHVAETEHMGYRLTLTELGGALFPHAMVVAGKRREAPPLALGNLMRSNEALIYMVDTSRGIEAMYEAKQRFCDVVIRLDPGTPICLIFNERRCARWRRRSTLLRVFQIGGLRRAGWDISTLVLTYDDSAPVVRMLSWTVAAAACGRAQASPSAPE